MKLLLVDDHPLVRKGLDFVLSLEKDIKVVGEANTIKKAVNEINDKKPDIVLIDIMLGNEYGLDILEESYKNKWICKFIVLTSSADVYNFKKAIELGASGYVLKDALPEELLYAVQLVSKGRNYYDPNIMDIIMQESLIEGVSDELTPREQEVLVALGEGLCNKDIAKKLFITEYTVKKHVGQIFAKLQLSDRTQAALYAQSRIGLQFNCIKDINKNSKLDRGYMHNILIHQHKVVR